MLINPMRNTFWLCPRRRISNRLLFSNVTLCLGQQLGALQEPGFGQLAVAESGLQARKYSSRGFYFRRGPHRRIRDEGAVILSRALGDY